ncbi:cryptochrome/photolyase family protein [Pelagimonas varians]|uniref:Deoxyribodipyrimidine photo-lyase-related protein n=1 Tax=Pelagimonas varians TaxID=696760 RepID=A0A238KEC0_9RHOB|nr:cryptochrome/photolyase family protein [Pelagimonas varians]PYG32475.1 deoxyribodipyrimidine photolyase-related protein [Pelagimonas varians]SMX41215.1 Deoxyribodipyrimidine photo-lyase-related protein [Pelagimonas varians]
MKLRLVLGDQLTETISSLSGASHDDLIVMCEVRDEATYVKHHKKKIVFLFSAMRHFAQSLSRAGYSVHYVTYDDPENSGSLKGEVGRLIGKHPVSEVVVTTPGEYRLLEDMKQWSSLLQIPVTVLEDDRFLSTPEEFASWAKGRKQLRMEYFYRDMRRKYGVLMTEAGPIGGQWNFDAENRKPPAEDQTVPAPFVTDMDQTTKDVVTLVKDHFPDHFGDILPFPFAVSRDGALQALDHFVSERLCLFGDFQDAMIQGEPWMYHSLIGLYLNCGLLTPMECIKRAEAAFHDGSAPLNSTEGFIRQILGWREFVRGLYWLKMPEYKELNFFDANRPLPDFYWTGQTQMNCLRQCIEETKQNAYAHHIQRLMVLGNFALIAGIDPKQVQDWYLLVYADAYDWVELPNVSGMALFADGGLLASKPYAASGSYINKMSDYCSACRYSPTVKNGPKACPFNYLYWDFMQRNAAKLRGNPRLGFVFRNMDRMSDEKRWANGDDALRFFKEIGINEKI